MHTPRRLKSRLCQCRLQQLWLLVCGHAARHAMHSVPPEGDTLQDRWLGSFHPVLMPLGFFILGAIIAWHQCRSLAVVTTRRGVDAKCSVVMSSPVGSTAVRTVSHSVVLIHCRVWPCVPFVCEGHPVSPLVTCSDGRSVRCQWQYSSLYRKHNVCCADTICCAFGRWARLQLGCNCEDFHLPGSGSHSMHSM